MDPSDPAVKGFCDITDDEIFQLKISSQGLLLQKISTFTKW